MKLHQRKLCIVGAGGFGREVLSSFKNSFELEGKSYEKEVLFLDDNPALKNQTIMGVKVISTSEFNAEEYAVVIAVGDPNTRKKIVDSLPSDTKYATLIHPNAIVADDAQIGEGSIVTAGCIVTCNIVIGKHAHLNLNSTVGHDCRIGDYFTTAPGVHISGECEFNDCVYFGTNASVRQGISICENVTIGMGGIVVKHISEPGVYIGNPTKKLETK